MIAVSSVLSRCQRHFPDLREAEALELINEVNLDLIEDLRLVPDVSVIISLVAGQMEYVLPNPIIRIWEASFESAAGQFTSLEQTSTDELDQEQDGYWRSGLTTGQPSSIYYRGGNVGFWPVPDTTTVAGYPNVTLFVSEVSGQLNINSTLPPTVITANAYVYEVCARYAAMVAKDQVDFFKTSAQKEKARLVSRSYGILPRDEPRVLPRIKPLRYF